MHFVYEERTKEIYNLTLAAFLLGKPKSLHYDSDKKRQKKRRDEALAGLPSMWPRYERDEYPYASTFEGGKGAIVDYVLPEEQRKQGGDLQKLYSGLKHGEAFIVVPVPKEKVPDPKPVPVPYVPPVRKPAPNPGGRLIPSLLQLRLFPFIFINPILFELETNPHSGQQMI